MKAPSPALVVAIIALFVALGGTGYAVTALPRDSVGTAQIANGSVLPEDLSASVSAAASSRAKATGARGPKGAKGATGPRGAQGAAGAKGDTGATGATGLSSAKYVYDGNGATLGDLIAVTAVNPSGASFYVRINGRIWSVNSNGTFGGSGDHIWWTTNTCTGVPVYLNGLTPEVRNPGNLSTPIVEISNSGSVVAYDVPSDRTTRVIAAGASGYFKLGDGTCNRAITSAASDYYGATLTTPITPPTLVAPLTIG